MLLEDSQPSPRHEEGLLPLINIIMLLLVFFLITGAIAPKAPAAITLAETGGAERLPLPEGALAIRQDGVWLIDGEPADAAALSAYTSQLAPEALVYVVADRELPAAILAKQLGALARLGVAKVRLVADVRQGPTP